jgi:type I restriction enzyme M protein
VLRRLDCVLAPTKPKVLETVGKLKAKDLQNLDPQLRRASAFVFYNTSRSAAVTGKIDVRDEVSKS